jgi:hypothetical protein
MPASIHLCSVTSSAVTKSARFAVCEQHRATWSYKQEQLWEIPSFCMRILLWHVDLLLGNDRKINNYTTAVAK